jgi:putative sigma-54 modulation protein
MKGDGYMKIIVAARHMKVSDDFVKYAASKLEKFDSYFDESVEAHVTFSHRDDIQIFEVTILMKRGVVLRGEDSDRDMRTAIDSVVSKISRQIRKHKSKLEKKYRGNESIKFAEALAEFDKEREEEEPEIAGKIVKSKRFGVKPMDAEEAAMQMELIGHDFFVFLNADTDEVNVIYTRKDGNFGLIEPYF